MSEDSQVPCDKFICEDCGADIVSIPAVNPPPTRCATCTWLEEFVPDPVEREELRRRMTG